MVMLVTGDLSHLNSYTVMRLSPIRIKDQISIRVFTTVTPATYGSSMSRSLTVDAFLGFQ